MVLTTQTNLPVVRSYLIFQIFSVRTFFLGGGRGDTIDFAYHKFLSRSIFFCYCGCSDLSVDLSLTFGLTLIMLLRFLCAVFDAFYSSRDYNFFIFRVYAISLIVDVVSDKLSFLDSVI